MRRRLRALLSRLHLLQTLSERPGDTVVTIGPNDSVSALAARVAPDGDVLVVDESVDELERVRRDTTEPNVFFLLGTLEVLPLTDSSVDEVIATGAIRADALAESFRVLRPGGKLALDAADEEPTGRALNLDPHEVERLFVDMGFVSVSVADARGRVAILALKP